MRRRERALTTELRLNVNPDENLSGMSPLFTHRLIHRSPVFHVRSQNYFVRASNMLTAWLPDDIFPRRISLNHNDLFSRLFF